MSKSLLQGVHVLDIAGEPLAMAARMLADLGAQVVKLEPPGGDPLRQVPPLDPATGISFRFSAFSAGTRSVEYQNNETQTEALLRGAHIVLETPGFPGALQLPRERAPAAVWLQATPFGMQGPQAQWRASDLGILAASGNLYATGYADSAPVRCAEPVAYAHASAEAVVAVLAGLASGSAQTIDLSMAEAVMLANMGASGQYPKTGNPGRRMGAAMGITREIWPCADGYVSFGLRGGPARAHNFEILLGEMLKAGIDVESWQGRDWLSFNALELGADEVQAIEQPLQDYFALHSMTHLYALAVTTNLMLAPANSAAEILASEQLAHRKVFAQPPAQRGLPQHFVTFREADGTDERENIPGAPPALNAGPCPEWPALPARADKSANAFGNKNDDRSSHNNSTGAGNTRPLPWQALRLLEFGSGAAGPITSRYFAEQGATVIKVESSRHPDFLRVMASRGPHGLEGSTLFDSLNAAKHSITLNLKHPEGKAIAVRLYHWADAVLENFAPKAMQRHGLDYRAQVQEKPDLLMLSSCLNGQTGPHRDYPGFGGQGAALCGFNYLTGWPDREPIGPFGTITDSLSPRFAAAALSAALLYRQRTGKGLHLDLSQVETGVYSLSPWLLEHASTGIDRARGGNHSERAVPHGVFPCAGEDRWIAIACWEDAQWRVLAERMGRSDLAGHALAARLQRREDVESALAHWTGTQPAPALAQALQAAGIEAVPVMDFAQLLESDPQLASRGHFVSLERAVTGISHYERNGYRFADDRGGYHRPAPLLGEHTGHILANILGLDNASIAQLQAAGALA